MFLRVAGVLVIIIGAAVSNGFGDHLPEKLQARGRPETILGRINLRNTSIEEIVKLYGKPTEEKRWEPSLPNSSGSIDYYWRKKGLNLHVQIQFLPNDPKWKPVGLVEVGVGTLSSKSRTGAGLSLGSTLSDLKRIYGRRFHLRNIPKLKIHDVMIQWRKEEYSLVAALDNRNRITSLSLAAPE
jgi:hypothetical protein